MGRLKGLKEVLERLSSPGRTRVPPLPRPGPLPPPPLPVPLPEPAPTPVPGTSNPPTATEGAQEGAEAQTETETKKRNKGCCNPFKFRYHWPKGTRPSPKPEGANKRNPKLARMFQIYTCGTIEYLCSGGASVWADGLKSEMCWMEDAKWTTDPKRSPFVPGTVPPFLDKIVYGKLIDEFTRYGSVCRAPSIPAHECWQIGLIVYVNTPATKPFFAGLCRSTIPSHRWRVEVRHMPSGDMKNSYEKDKDVIEEIGKTRNRNYNDPINELDRDISDRLDRKTIYNSDGSRMIIFPDF